MAEQPLLTEDELAVIDRTVELVAALTKAVPPGPNRDRDLGELIPHIHVIQHAVMAQAAARSYPDLFRGLGETMRGR